MPHQPEKLVVATHLLVMQQGMLVVDSKARVQSLVYRPWVETAVAG